MSSDLEIPKFNSDDGGNDSYPSFAPSGLDNIIINESFELRNRRVVKLYLPESHEGTQAELQPEGLDVAIRIARVQGAIPKIVGFEKVVDEETGKVTYRIGPYGVQALFPGSRPRPNGNLFK